MPLDFQVRRQDKLGTQEPTPCAARNQLNFRRTTIKLGRAFLFPLLNTSQGRAKGQGVVGLEGQKLKLGLHCFLLFVTYNNN
ncbi:hypothetical protein Pfo_007211 [Paulownia fortunei]|nr:hypothetical protein Pfo_007211 [Paulownia fortunei]